MSAALNLARYGSIGASPGGNRVEDFSTPLQFLIALGVFKINPTSYQAFLDWQVVISLVFTGALVVGLLLGPLRPAPAIRHAPLVAILLSSAVVLSVLASWTTTGWIASGMENSLVLVLGSAVAYLAVRGSNNLVGAVLLAVAVALLGLTRVEFPLFMVPLLAGSALLVWDRVPHPTRKIATALALIIPGVTWGIVTLARYIYFGHLEPNTALVEGKTGVILQLSLLGGLTLLAIGFYLLCFRRILGTAATRFTWIAVLASSGFALIGMIALHPKVEIREVYIFPVLLACLALLMLLVDRYTSDPWSPDALFLGLVFIPLAQVIVVGPARLDPFRVASLAIPFLATWVAVTAARLLALRSVVPADPEQAGRQRSRLIPAGIGLVILFCFALVISHDRPRNLCCVITPSQYRVLSAADSMQKYLLGGTALPIEGSPDLGKLSFAKRTMVEDLGYLDEPVLARIQRSHPELAVQYLNAVAKPDIVRLGSDWSCTYQDWVNSAAFKSSYVLGNESAPIYYGFAPSHYKDCPRSGKFSLWTRSTPSTEYALTREIASASDPATVVRKAVRVCRDSGTSAFRCEYVRRSILRNAETLKTRGLMDAAASALEGSPSAKLDIPLLGQHPGWDAVAYDAFVRLAASPTA
ncbi:MAG TPA: hypothetical protein VIH95_08625 [Acidimicrobiales bacterium]